MIRHELKWGSVIRGTYVDGQAWFVLRDLTQACGRPYPRRIRTILLFNELAKIKIDGSYRWAVNSSGMLALLHKKNSALMRRLALELILAFPDEIMRTNQIDNEIFTIGIYQGGTLSRIRVFKKGSYKKAV